MIPTGKALVELKDEDIRGLLIVIENYQEQPNQNTFIKNMRSSIDYSYQEKTMLISSLLLSDYKGGEISFISFPGSYYQRNQ